MPSFPIRKNGLKDDFFVKDKYLIVQFTHLYMQPYLDVLHTHNKVISCNYLLSLMISKLKTPLQIIRLSAGEFCYAGCRAQCQRCKNKLKLWYNIYIKAYIWQLPASTYVRLHNRALALNKEMGGLYL